MESTTKGANVKTYPNVIEAQADPNSTISRFLRDARETMSENERVIAQWMARGLTREQAYQRALFG